MGKAAIVIATTAALATFALASAAVFIYAGAYDVGATRQHTQPVYSLLETAMHRSVRLRARNIDAPALNDERMILRGAACFRDKCVQCHGAPGVAQEDIGKSMQPLPGPLVDARQHWQPRELYWITRHGIRLSGMPAWEFRLSDEDLWDLVAFMQRLPDLTPRAYDELTQRSPQATGIQPAAACGREGGVSASRAGDVERGKLALYQYACSACHTIPGVTGSSPMVGPPLKGMAGRALIAGRLDNTPQNMVRWLRQPHEVKPGTAMPDLRVTHQHAADMAAYLATLR